MQNADNNRADREHSAEYTRRLFEAATAAVDDPLLVFDTYWRLIHLNSAADATFSTHATGTPLREVVPPELLALIETQTSGEWAQEDRVFVPHVSPVSGEMGRVEGWIVVLKDVTRLMQLKESQRQFVSTVSHDLRSPLTTIQGFAGMLEQQLVGDLNEKQAQFVGKILSSLAQFTALLDNIQDAGRFDIDSGAYDMRCSFCDLRDLVNGAMTSHRNAAEARGLQVDVEFSADLPVIYADATMLERALRNLVDNAVNYTPDGGTISVRAQRDGDFAVLSVSDTGIGISPDDQARLFQRHVRLARKDHRKIRGSGLGLFIVKNVALRHGGAAWVESVEGEGSTFYMSIPLNPNCHPS